ncbi:hypothetical protein HK405_004558 [Cladochytrium tenue]|nr:hypothetical protein HK405_004558 [Cladochytrium tenue]
MPARSPAQAQFQAWQTVERVRLRVSARLATSRASLRTPRAAVSTDAAQVTPIGQAVADIESALTAFSSIEFLALDADAFGDSFPTPGAGDSGLVQ